MSNTIAIEVAYAMPDKQSIIKLDVPEGTTVMQRHWTAGGCQRAATKSE